MSKTLEELNRDLIEDLKKQLSATELIEFEKELNKDKTPIDYDKLVLKLNSKLDEDIKLLMEKKAKYAKLESYLNKEKLGETLYEDIEEKLFKLSNEHPTINYYENISYKNKNLIQYSFQSSNYTRKKIIEITAGLSKYLLKNGHTGKISNVLFYEDIKWRSNPNWNEIGETEINLFQRSYNGLQFDEPAHHKRFIIYLLLDSKKPIPEAKIDKVGQSTDNKNNCLWECLNYFMKALNPFKTPESLKSFCGVKYTDKIPLEYISKIETHLKTFSLYLTGDFIYNSPNPKNKQIHLIVEDEHIKINYKKEISIHKYKNVNRC